MDIFVNIARNGVYNGVNVKHKEVCYKEHHNACIRRSNLLFWESVSMKQISRILHFNITFRNHPYNNSNHVDIASCIDITISIILWWMYMGISFTCKMENSSFVLKLRKRILFCVGFHFSLKKGDLNPVTDAVNNGIPLPTHYRSGYIQTPSGVCFYQRGRKYPPTPTPASAEEIKLLRV